MAGQRSDPNLLLAHAAFLRRLAGLLVRDPGAIDDAVQETWLAALRRPPDPSLPARPWLSRVLRNLVRTRARALRYEARRDERVVSEGAARAPLPTAEALLERHELLRLLAGLVSELEEPLRATVLLWCEEGLSPSEIAARQGVPAGTVRWRLKEGLDRVRRELDRRHGGDRRAWCAILGPLASQEPGWEGPASSLGKGLLLMTAKTKVGAVVAVVALILVGGLAVWRLSGGPKAGGPPVTTAPLGPVLFAPDPEIDPSLPAGTVEGTVRTPAGSPAEGATVILMRQRSGDAVNSPAVATGVAASAGGGRFRFADVPPGQYGLTATLPGAAPARHGPFEIRAGDTARIELVLDRGGAVLSGRVLDVGGGPIPGAIVRAVEAPGGSAEPLPRLYQAAADETGLYLLPLRRGRYALLAVAEGYAAGTDSVYLARDTSRDLRLMPASRISGRAIERGSRRPVAEADVWLAWDGLDGSRTRDMRTDGQGRFAFPDVEPGSYRVTARKGPLVGVGTQVTVGVAETADGVEVELGKGLSVRGSVTGPSGPIQGAQIEARKGELPPERPVLVRAGPGGAYELPGLLPGRYFVTASAEGHGRANRTLTLTSGDSDGVDLELDDEVRISGQVRDEAGRTVKGALVDVRVRPRTAGIDGSGSGITDDAGRFDIGALIAGSLSIKAEQRGVGAVEHGPLEVSPGDREHFELVFERAASLSGTVRFEDGEPASDVQVSAIPRRRLVGWTLASAEDTTGPDGRYSLAALLPGQLVVTASRKGALITQETEERGDRKTIALAAGEARTAFDLTIPRGGRSIAGTVVDPDGRPVALAAVAAVPERKDSKIVSRPAITQRAITRDDGAFLLEDLDGGPHALWASHPSFPELRHEGVGSGRQGVTLRFRRSGWIDGIVLGGDGRPVSDYSIVLLAGAVPGETAEQKASRQQGGTAGRPNQRVHDPSGAFSFRRLDPGSYELQVGSADGRIGAHGVTLSEGERKSGLRVKVEAGLKLTGRVVEYQSDQAVPGVPVYCYAPGGFERTATSEADGRFVLEGLTGGQMMTVYLRPDPRSHVPDAWAFEIPAGRKEGDVGTLRIVRGDLEAKQAALNRVGYGSLGLNTRAHQGHVSIASVEVGLPGHKGGIAVGDHLLTIDGRDVHDLGAAGVRFFMIGKADTDVTFELASGPNHVRRKVTVTRVARNR